MSSYQKDDVILFGAISFAHASVPTLGAGGARYAPFSITGALTPRYTISPTETTAANIAAFVATFVNHMMSRKQ